MSEVDEATAKHIIDANLSPRAKRLLSYEQFVEGTQYDGRPDWFSDVCPLWERKPCVIYPIVRSAIDSNVDLLLGEGRFPTVSTRPGEDDEKYAPGESGLNLDDSSHIDYLIAQMYRQTQFRALCREVYMSGQASGTAVAIHTVRNGRLCIDTTRARWCEPVYDADDDSLEKLIIQYPYMDMSTVLPGGKRLTKVMIYRRIIDATSDVEYFPAEAKPNGQPPERWVRNNDKSVDHNLGFCPVVWYAFMKGNSIIGNYDGHPIHENLLDEVQALDFALSQRHRAALYAGDPQWTEIGVEMGFNPSPGGRSASIPSTTKGGYETSENPVTGHYRDINPDGRSSVRKKSPGSVWQYEDQNTKVQLHTLPGDGLKALEDHAKDLRVKIAESLCVIFTDPEHIRYAASVSGKALAALRQRQVDRVGQHRTDFATGFIEPSTSMQLRIAHKMGDAMRLPGLKLSRQILASFEDAHVLATA